jgi:hypothetical protein
MTCDICDRKNQYWCIECSWHRRHKNMQCLTKIYDPWREKNNFEKGCAEELYIKLLDDPEKYKGQLKWLKKFIRIWEIAEHGKYVY